MMRRSIARYASNGPLYILYGSQTGTAETFARMLGPVAVQHNYDPVLCSLDDAIPLLTTNAHIAKPKAVVCICSTYGVGAFPLNAQKFAAAIEEGTLSKLKGTQFTVLGLGNSQLRHSFNAAAKTLDAAFERQGAQRISEAVLSCNMTQNHEKNFKNWSRVLWNVLGTAEGAKAGAKPPLTYDVPIVHGARADKQVLPWGFARGFVNRNFKLSKNVDATPENPHVGQLVLTVPIVEQIAKLNGRTATLTDNIMVYPKNSDATVARAMKRLGLERADLSVEVTPLPGSPSTFVDHRKMRIDTLLQRLPAFTAFPSRNLLAAMAAYCDDAAQKAALTDLAENVQPGNAYDAKIKGVWTVMDALEEFDKVNVTLPFVLSFVPHIQERAYSIARDNTDWKNDEFEIVYNVPVRRADGHEHRGLASSMLESLKTGDALMVRFQPSPTRVLPAHDRPLCIVALGSGIGAARALLHRRRIAMRSGSVKVAPCVLYYGHRKSDDALFLDELALLEKEGVCDVVKTASHETAGKFVTPMNSMTATIKDFLGNNGEICYCGLGGSVPRVVEDAFVKFGVDVAGMRASGRYHEEYFTADQDTEHRIARE